MIQEQRVGTFETNKFVFLHLIIDSSSCDLFEVLIRKAAHCLFDWRAAKSEVFDVLDAFCILIQQFLKKRAWCVYVMSSLPILPTGIIWEEPIPAYDDSFSAVDSTQPKDGRLHETFHQNNDVISPETTGRTGLDSAKDDAASVVDLCTMPVALEKTTTGPHASPVRSQEPSWIEDKRTRSGGKMKQATLFQFLQHK